MNNRPLKMILEFHGREVKRQFDKSIEKTPLGRALYRLKRRKSLLVKTFPKQEKIFDYIFDEKNFDNLFFTLQPVPWYLDLIANELKKAMIRDPSQKFTVKIKACKSHHFIDIYQPLADMKRKLLSPPFFHKATLPDEVTNGKEIIRGVADTLIFLASTIPKRAKDNEINDLFNWFEIELKAVKLNKLDNNRYELLIEPDINWRPHIADESKKCIRYYSSTKREERLILVASPNVRDAIQQLSEVWHNPIAKSVLLSAWTGSGKEELKELLIYGLRITEEHFLVSRSAPEITSNSESLDNYLKDNLLRELINNGVIDSKTGELRERPVVLFFDEIHHQSVEKLRAALLRFMEDTKTIVDNKKIDYKGVLFLFAASKSPKELRSYPPPDFWTRIEYFVEMQHPLDLKNQGDRNDALKQYFCLFWRNAAKERGKREAYSVIKYLERDNILESLADAFAEALDSPLIPLISVRAIRSIVNRLFSRAIYHTRTTEIKGAKIVKEITSHMDEWIVDIRKEIVPEIDPQGVF